MDGGNAAEALRANPAHMEQLEPHDKKRTCESWMNHSHDVSPQCA